MADRHRGPDELTFDRPAPGLVIAQPRRGFRYGSEAFWLAGLILEGGVPRAALDLGTGSGVVAALLAGRGARALGVDVREEWRPCWEETLRRSTLAGTLELRVHDLSQDLPGAWPVVVGNPPFFPRGAGPVSPDGWKAAARTESTASLSRFVEVAAGALEPGGRAVFVVPRERGGELIAAAARVGLGAAEEVLVGARRRLFSLSRAPGIPRRSTITESDPRARRWVDLARGGWPT